MFFSLKVALCIMLHYFMAQIVAAMPTEPAHRELITNLRSTHCCSSLPTQPLLRHSLQESCRRTAHQVSHAMSFLTSALSYRTPVLPIMLSSKLLPEMEAEQHKAEAPLRAAISKLSPAQQLDYLQKQVSGSTPCGVHIVDHMTAVWMTSLRKKPT